MFFYKLFYYIYERCTKFPVYGTIKWYCIVVSLEIELERDKRERDARERDMRERELREMELREKMKQELEMKPPGTCLGCRVVWGGSLNCVAICMVEG